MHLLLQRIVPVSLSLLFLSAPQKVNADATQNVIFVMTDGLRWQEVFRGADAELLDHMKGTDADKAHVRKAYWRESVGPRREALMPFLWNVAAKQGQIFGNRDQGSEASVTNGLNFSYPGYSETLCGFPDPGIRSNDKVPNPNVTVLEWLHRKPAYAGKVAAFGAWDTFPAIFNAERAGFLVNAGYDAMPQLTDRPAIALVNRLKLDTPRIWEGEPFDVIPFETAAEYLQVRKPRVLFLSLGETDEWAHGGDYGQYLHSAHRADEFLKRLWSMVESMPEYRGKTTLIFSPDHGRGSGPEGWRSHGEKLPESKYIWLAIMGPDTRALGERKNVSPVQQSQIAATIAALLGEDYAGAVPKAGKPLAEVIAASSTATRR